jgi:hypothetical protein
MNFEVAVASTGGNKIVVGNYKCTQKIPQAHEYCYSFYLGVFQSIVFIHRETMVKEANNSPSCIY